MSKHPVVALVALAVLLGAGSAEARFGKRTRKQEQEAPPPAESAPSGAPPPPRVVVVRPVPAPPVVVPYAGWVSGSHWHGSYWGPPVPGPVVVRRRVRLMPEAPPPQAEAPEEVSPLHVAFTTDAQLYGRAAGLGLGFLVEGERLGLVGRLDALSLPTDDGTFGRDGLTLLSLKPGVALVATDTTRLRLVAGLDAAFAPDASFLGAGLGFQLERCLFGPLDLEAVAELTPLPFTRVDLQGGLAMHLGPLALRGGWRYLLLSDQGRVDGYENTDVMAGPYLGLGLHF